MKVSAPLNIRLEQYEGPLDLLLDLIRKQKLDIRDIPIAKITADYLAYMEQAAELDIELSSEFIYMAATLIHIKSRTLLPRDPELDALSPEEDPRQELVARLLEHQRFKDAAEMLQQKRLLEESVWSNPELKQFFSDDEDPGLAVTLFDLVKTMQAVLDRHKNRPVFEVADEDVSVPQMIQFIAGFLRRADTAPVLARELFEQQPSRRAMICLFLAILEMARAQAIVLRQAEALGEIEIRRHRRFEEALASPGYLAEIDKDYQ